MAVPDSELKRRYSIFVCSPPFDALSGGVRALFLLGHHLRARGFNAYMSTRATGTEPPYDTPIAPRERMRVSYPGDVVVYPEIYEGNFRGGTHVVRFLLNRPGVVKRDLAASFGTQDFFLHFDRSHVPAGRESQDLYTPLVDRRFYHRNGEAAVREGYVVCSKREPLEDVRIPGWAKPLRVVTAGRLKSHAELGDLYRRSKALIVYERTTAIYEALCCGCPVICFEMGPFRQASFQPRFEGAGMTWDISPAGLAAASAGVDRFNEIYAGIESTYPDKVEAAFLSILREAARRAEARGQPL